MWQTYATQHKEDKIMTNTEKKTLLAEFEKFLNIQTEELTVRHSTTVQTDEYEVGDIIDFTLKTGEEVSAMAMRKEADGMLFVFVDCLKTEYPMNSSNTNKGGYGACLLRKKLNGEILDSFPDSLKARMKPVYKDDKLRLLTAMEVFGKNSYEDKVGGEYLPFMGDIRNRIAFRGKDTGTWEWYWLQNTLNDSAADFACVTNSGYANYAGAPFGRGVRPAFKI